MNIYFMFMNINGFDLGIDSKNQESIDCFKELISIFGTIEGDKVSINFAQIATDELKKKIELFVDKFASNGPILNRLQKKISQVPTGEIFFVMPGDPPSTADMLAWQRMLVELNASSNESKAIAQQENEQLMELFNDLLNTYDVDVINSENRISFGEANKKLRKCRFCKKTEATGATFKKKAHAISEALGNKSIVLFDECDVCNGYFGSEIEISIIEYCNINRVYLGIKGSNGDLTVNFKNGSFSNLGGQLVLSVNQIDGTPESSLKTMVESPRMFKPIDFYKSLCKYVMSVIPAENLPDFEDTIAWIRYNEQEDIKVPRIAESIVHAGFCRSPQLTVYIRKTQEQQFPHVVGEFRLGSYVYVFVLPFSKKDNVDFSSDENFKEFWSKFKHYDLHSRWKFMDFSSSKAASMNFAINMINSSQQSK